MWQVVGADHNFIYPVVFVLRLKLTAESFCVTQPASLVCLLFVCLNRRQFFTELLELKV